ncbi:class I adenylate-forming enzyme family protein [Actinoplanes sp. NPDC000266]
MTATLTIDLDSHQRALRPMTIPEALDYAAATWGDRLALTTLEDDQPSYTWAQLRQQIAQLRSGFEQAGIAPGTKVGIMLGNDRAFPLSWLAVIEAGAVAVPLNPKYTAREVDFILRDAGATWLITTSETAQRLVEGDAVGPVLSANIIEAEGRLTELMRSPVTPRTHVPGPRDVVNIQFTSGTTGLPKGCLLTHEYWVEFGVYSSALFDQPQRLLADHPFYYMQNQAYFWIALAGGGALYVTKGLSRRKFMGWLRDHRIDFAWIDEFMLEEPERDDDRQLGIKKAPIAGIYGDTHRALEERFGLQARDWYASTEAGNGTFVPWERTDLVGVPTIGLAWATRETKIVDEYGQDVPAGQPGELCLRGTGMMLGYHNRPDVNAELFLEGGWYRTGDLVRKNADGLHYFEGRLKDMIKRSGENISCAEVELHIMGLPEVQEAGVIPVPDPDRGEEVKAVIVLKADADLSVEKLEAWCRQGLAAFKIPRYVEFRDALPHTPSGKVAKSELRSEPDPFGDNVLDLRPVKSALR